MMVAMMVMMVMLVARMLLMVMMMVAIFPKALHNINSHHTIVILNINTSSRLSNSEYHTIVIFIT